MVPSKKRLIVYILLLAVAVWLMVFLRSSHNKKQNFPVRDWQEIVETGQINVVTDYNLIGYHVSGDSITGFQYDMIKKLEQSWSVKINIFLVNSLDESLEGLKEGKFDIVARNIPINTSLREEFLFTNPISLNKQVLVQRKAAFNEGRAPLRHHLDLRNKTINVASASPAIMRLNNLAHEIGDTIYIVQHPKYESEQLIMMVAGGDIDFTVSDEVLAMKLAQTFPEIDIETDIGFTQFESWALRTTSPALLDSLNYWLSHFVNTPEYNQLQNKYFKTLFR